MGALAGGIRAADHGVPRAHPCSARDARPGAPVCGARPAMPWRRSCANGHDRLIWLCPPHATIMLTHACHCAECLDRGGRVAAVLEPCLEVAP